MIQSQESEFEERRRHAKQSEELINTLKQHVEQLVKRYYQHTASSSENSVLLLDLLLKELMEIAEKAVASVANDIEASGNSLLPALRNDPGKLLKAAIEELNTADLEEYICEHFSEEEYHNIKEAFKIIRMAIRNLKSEAKLSSDQVVKRFTECKERYSQEHEQSLLFFREECDDCREERERLYTLFHNNRAVQIWLRNDMNICKTINDMEAEGCEEEELTKLFAFIVRAEILHEMANEMKKLPAKPSATPTPPSDAKVKTALQDVLEMITCSRHWVCIYRALVQAGKISKSDYKGFESYIIKLIGKPKTPINLKDMTYKVDVDCFALDDIDDWTEEKSSVKGKTFKTYQNLAKEFLTKIS